jgi:pimeloyl-ACP methyl ester carboxylesterase
MNTMRVFYTALVQDLASHGFVVAAIDHPFWTIASAFSDGGGQRLADGMAVRDQLTSDQIDGFMEDGVRAMAVDQAFVAARLSAVTRRFATIIDPARIGVMGHSMGGMAATQACWTYRIFNACASLDGLVWTREGLAPIGEPPNRVAKPFLLLLAPQFLPADLAGLGRRYRRAWDHPSICLVRGSRHNSVTDLPALRARRPRPGEPDPEVAARAFRRAVAAFFVTALQDGAPDSARRADSLVGSLPGDSMPSCPLTSR